MTAAETTTAPTTKSIYAKLIAAQSEFSGISKDCRASIGGKGASYYEYADISAVLTVLRPILNRHGLGILQKTKAEGHSVTVETIVFDDEGEKISSGELTVPTEGLVQKGVQAFGSAVTYARRYSLVTFLSAAYGEQDDDGQKADEPDPGPEYRRPAPRRAPPPQQDFVLTEAMVDEAKAVAAQGPESYKQYFSSITKVQRKALIDSGWHVNLKAMSQATVEG